MTWWQSEKKNVTYNLAHSISSGVRSASDRTGDVQSSSGGTYLSGLEIVLDAVLKPLAFDLDRRNNQARTHEVA